MLERLLESRARRERQLTGTAVSVVAHSAIIGAAFFATARARPAQEKPEAHPLTRFYVAPPPPVIATTTPTTVRVPPVRPFTFEVPAIKLDLASADIGAAPGAVTIPESGGLASLSNVVTDGAGLPGGTDHTFRPDQVERQVSLQSGAAPPRYPEALRSAGVEGAVTARFVVSEKGIVESDSVVFVRSGNPLFEGAVRDALRRMRFVPAEVGGRKVRQLVEMPFIFTLNK